MDIPAPHPAAEIVFEALIKTARSESFSDRVHSGMVHEACVVIGAWALARQGGVEANLIDVERLDDPAHTVQAPVDSNMQGCSWKSTDTFSP